MNMTKDEALAKIEELKRYVEQKDAEPDYASWEGKWGFGNDDDPECPNDGFVEKLSKYVADSFNPFRTEYVNRWRYFRPARPDELGFQGYDDMLDFIKRQTRINPEHPEDESWSWHSLISEAKRIIGSIE